MSAVHIIVLVDPRMRTATLLAKLDALLRRNGTVKGAGKRHAPWQTIAAIQRELARRGVT